MELYFNGRNLLIIVGYYLIINLIPGCGILADWEMCIRYNIKNEG